MKFNPVIKSLFIILIGLIVSCKKHKSVEDLKKPFWQISLQLAQPDSRFLDIEFQNDDTGFALAVEGSANKYIIYKTGDGGKNWQPFVSNLSNDPLNSIAVNNNTLFSTGHHIYSSTDNGLNWDNLNPPFEGYRDIQFLSKDVGIVINGNIIRRTIDQGTTWKEVFDSRQIASFRKFFFTDNYTGYVIGGDTHDNVNYGIIAKTTDNGLTWNLLYVPFVNLKTIYFLDSKKGFLTDFHDWVYKTEDGGNTWKLINNSFYADVTSSYFSTEKDGYLGGSESIFHTFDGGKTWEEEFSQANTRVNKIISTSTTLFAISNNGIILTKKIK